MNKSPQNFERLVLVCIDSYDSEKGRILQHFSRSTRFAFLCTAQISNFQQKNFVIFFAFFRKISRKFSKFCHFSAKFWWILPRISRNVQQFSEKTKKMLICRKFSNFCEICWYFRNWWKSSFVHFIVSIVSLLEIDERQTLHSPAADVYTHLQQANGAWSCLNIFLGSDALLVIR